MILNSLSREYGFSPVRVTLDGRDVTAFCFYADDQAGYVGLYVTEDVPGARATGDGPTRRVIKDGEVLKFGVTGTVVIEKR